HQHIITTEERLGRRMDINNSYYAEFDTIAKDWEPGNPNKRGLSQLAFWDVEQGRIPLIGWSCGKSSAIARGDFDEVIRKTGEAFKAFGHEFMMRYCWEMDGNKRAGTVGSPEDFIAAWRRIYDIIANQVGAKNVVWVWCGNAAHFKRPNDGGHYAFEYYPGDDVVDWISSDGYNWGVSDRNGSGGHDDRWRGFVEIFDEFMLWARSTGPSGPTAPADFPDVFPNKTQVKPIQIGEYGAIEPSEDDQNDPNDDRQEHYLSIAPHLTKPDWMKETHDAVNGAKVSQWSPTGCHWCGIYSDIAAVVYFDINADGSDQNGDWRIRSSRASTDSYISSAAQDPWFKQIHNIGWPASANSNYISTGQPPVQQPPVQQPPVQQPP
ncbi:MAG: glycosyl hydrolase, partial [Actinomycetota bacterium]